MNKNTQVEYYIMVTSRGMTYRSLLTTYSTRATCDGLASQRGIGGVAVILVDSHLYGDHDSLRSSG